MCLGHCTSPPRQRRAIFRVGNETPRDRILYGEKMKALIHGWRELWQKSGRMPFYYVQISPFQSHWHNPALKPYEVPLLWEA